MEKSKIDFLTYDGDVTSASSSVTLFVSCPASVLSTIGGFLNTGYRQNTILNLLTKIVG